MGRLQQTSHPFQDYIRTSLQLPSDRGAYTNPQIKLRSPSELEPVLFSLYSLSFPSDQGPLINGIALRPGHTAFDTQKIYSK